MDDQQSADVVTIKEAIEKVKKWSEEKDYEKVKEGSEEILAVEPDNEEIKALLETANKELGGQAPAVEPEPETVPEPVSEPTPEPEPQPEMEQMDVEPTSEPAPETAKEEKPAEEAKPKGKSGMGKLVLVVVLILILGGLAVSFFMGWLNPVFESALGLLGL